MATSELAGLGIILCDQVIEDRRTRKKSYIGVFNDILVGKFPARHPCFFLAVSVTGCLGQKEMEIRITREADYGEEEVMRLKGNVESANPLNVIEMVFEMRDFPIQKAGRYGIEIFALPEETRIAQRFFNVKQAPHPPQQPPQQPPAQDS